jgi:hypothetical protein
MKREKTCQNDDENTMCHIEKYSGLGDQMLRICAPLV